MSPNCGMLRATVAMYMPMEAAENRYSKVPSPKSAMDPFTVTPRNWRTISCNENVETTRTMSPLLSAAG